jgi:DNA-binding NtrC family response regulator
MPPFAESVADEAQPLADPLHKSCGIMRNEIPASATGDGKHVLIVDDDCGVLSLIEQWLTAAGCRVVACSQYQIARDHLQHTPPDILLTDVRLGAFNGLQLVLLAKAQRSNTQVIVMSGFADPLLQKEIERWGAGFIAKPLTRDQVLVALGLV